MLKKEELAKYKVLAVYILSHGDNIEGVDVIELPVLKKQVLYV
jgi:hypothetical protein